MCIHFSDSRKTCRNGDRLPSAAPDLGPDESGDKRVRLRLARDEHANSLARFLTPAGLLGGRHRVRVSGPHVRAGDLIAVALHEPAERGDSGVYGECWILLSEVTRRTRERPGVARCPVRKRDGGVEESGVLRGGEPFALVARRVPNEVGQNVGGRLVRILPGDCPEPRQAGPGPICVERVTGIRLVGSAG